MAGASYGVWRRLGERVFRFPERNAAGTRWAVALLIFGLALAARLVLVGHASGLPFITFFPAIVLTTLICGWPQAVAVLLLACVSAAFLLPPPSWYGGNGPAHATISLVLFSVVCAFEITIVAALAEAVRVNYRLAAHEKMMFLELQHRVANTLQFIASMLTLARQDIATPEQADTVLEQGAARITAIGQLHRRMYEAAHDDRGFVPLLQDILAELFQGQAVAVHIDAAQARLPLSKMTPLVLLVTEAATNSAKHAFRQGAGGTFSVLLLPSGRQTLRLAVSDDGPGMAPNAGSPTSLGLRIMRGLAAQLGGELVVESRRGTCVSVEFPSD